MSEEERKRRADYLANRKKRISRRAGLLIAVLIIALLSAVFTATFNKIYYVSFYEQSSADYGVLLKDNDFYENENNYLGKDYAYVAALIDEVDAVFDYKLSMDADNEINYDYTYRIDAVLEIKAQGGEKPLYVTRETLKGPVSRYEADSSGVYVREGVTVDYDRYSDEAERFVKTYLKNTSAVATLRLEMCVDILSESARFDRLSNFNDYVASISIPLLGEATGVKITSDTPTTDGKILSYTTEAISNAFAVVAIVFGVAALILGAGLYNYVETSKNHDVTYESRKARLLAAYKSFIQKLVGGFDAEGYNELALSSFDDMLAVRDTIQSPILMDENEDRTRTRFLIPTNTNILYVYEIKVGDYDEIYAGKEEAPVEPIVYTQPETILTESELERAIRTYGLIIDAPVVEEEEEITEQEEPTEAEPEVVEEITEEPATEAADVAAEEAPEEAAALRILIHADPDFSFVEPAQEPTVVTVDAPTNVNMGEDEGSSVSYNITYKGETLISGKEELESEEVEEPTEIEIPMSITYRGEELIEEEGDEEDEDYLESEPLTEEIEIPFNITYKGEPLPMDD